MTTGTILWIGRGEGEGVTAVAEAPAWELAWARDVADALALPLVAFVAIVVDSPHPRSAFEAVTRLRREPSLPPVCVRLPVEAQEHTEALLAAGAAHVWLRHEGPDAGADANRLLETIGRLAHGARSAGPAAASPAADRATSLRPPQGIIGRSGAMGAVFGLVERAQGSRATVLLTGETGTGKEVLARAIHAGSPRKRAPFVAVNCAAFPDTLLESELFGHTRGAFTGADRAKRGLFEQADGGTLFLDEIGETSPPLQAKLLRVLQEREVRPVGGTRPRRIDVRLVAATNRDLRAEVTHGRLREDLYYRLAVFPISVPPLRTRREDVVPLAEHFLRRHGVREDKPGCSLSRDAADLLLAHPWPGNVRELENEIQRALALIEPGDPITPAELSEGVRNALEPVAAAAREGETLRETMARIEGWLVRRALAAHQGRRAATARTLGLTREGLYKKMKRYGIE